MEFFIDNLLVQIHLIIEMILVDRPCAMELQEHKSSSVWFRKLHAPLHHGLQV